MFPNFVLLFLLNTKNEVLLLRRINTPFCNQCYALPGGEIKLGETASQAAAREAKGTLNIEINNENLEFVHVMHRKCNEPEFFACVFKPIWYYGTIINNAVDRHDDMKWFALNKLPANIVSAHKHAIEQISKHVKYSEHGWSE